MVRIGGRCEFTERPFPCESDGVRRPTFPNPTTLLARCGVAGAFYHTRMPRLSPPRRGLFYFGGSFGFGAESRLGEIFLNLAVSAAESSSNTT